jgi:hypothetical protein
MSFRTAYNDLGNKRTSRGLNRGLIRDKTPKEEKKMMDEYYKKMRGNWTASNGRK